MNIVFDARVIQDHFPGIGRYAFNLLSELPDLLEAGESLIVLHDPITRNTRYDLAALRAQHNRRVMWMEYRRSVFDLRSVLRAPSVPRPQSSVMHYPYYVRPRAAHPPSVTTIFDAIAFLYPNYVPSARAQLSIRILHQIAIGASRKLITASQSAARDLARFFPSIEAKLVVVPLAAHSLFKPQSAPEIARVRAEFDLPDRFALYLGSNKPHKNLARLVEAWHLVVGGWRPVNGPAPTLDPPLLVIAGHQDPRYPEAQARARELGIEPWVRFVGSVSDAQAAALYSACALFVYPSLYEGFGMTPLEAMACGAPVACSNRSSLPEVTGDAAWLFDPSQPQDIASACLRVLRDEALRDQLRRRSLAQAARFSWRETARLTMNLYREVSERLRT